eukprot:15236286-Heterocapsa_arctica.AAC.1
MTHLTGRNASRPIQEEAPVGNHQVLRMLLREPVQEVPGARVGDFPPLPEPLRPTGTRQAQAPANRLQNPVAEGEA